MKSKQEFKKAFVRKSFSEYAELIKEHFTPSKESSLPYIGLEHIEQGTLRISSIGKSSDVISQKFKFKKNDILFGKLRPYFRKVVRPNFDGVCSTDIFVVRAKEEFSQTFLYYLMASQEFVNYSSQGSQGTKMPRASWDFLEEYEQGIPSLEEQEQIGKTLSDLDTKIQNLHNQNHTLEQTAQAIFQSWFVDFDGVTEFEDSELGKIPKGWSVMKISDICETFGGGTPSTKNPNYWNGQNHWLVPRDLTSSDRMFCVDSERKITDEGLQNCASKMHPEDSIFMTSRATIGAFCINKIPVATNQGFIVSRPKNPNHFYYIFLNYRNRVDEFIQEANGSTFLEISRGNFRQLPILIPSPEIIDDFQPKAKLLFENIFNNEEMIVGLTKTRDALLPKLMSGEIRV